MSPFLIPQCVYLLVSLLISWLVWRHYRERKYGMGDKYSTFWPRFWTGSIDTCVLWPMSTAVTLLLSLNLPALVTALLVGFDSAAWLIYTVVGHARYGMTVGKMVTKVRVVDFRTEGRISYRQAWLREGIPAIGSFVCIGCEIWVILTSHVPSGEAASGQVMESMPYQFLIALPGLWFLAEVITMFTNKKRRALHDFIAGTVVIRTNLQ